MRAPLRSTAVLALVVLALAFGVVVVSAGGSDVRPAVQPVSWRGLVGEPRAAVPLGQRMIVVLTTPSVGERLAQAHYATESQERAWWASAYAAQKQVLLKLAAMGISVRPDYSF